MNVSYYQLSNADLLLWSNDFSRQLTVSPGTYGVTAEQASEFAAANTTFDNALVAWRNNATRTPITSATKKAARESLLGLARYLVSSINSNPAATDAQREALGIRIRKSPSTIPAPTAIPLLDVVAIAGRRVTIELRASDGSRRGKPVGVKGASLFTFVGENAPTDSSMWKFEGLTTKTRLELDFENTTSANVAWVTANWFNERGEVGTSCAPVNVSLPVGLIVPRNKTIRLAA